MTWFRLYHEMIDDPKIRLLSPELRWNFIEILCISSKEKERGTLPGLPACAVQMRVSVGKAQRIIDALIQAGLIDEPVDGQPLSIHGWHSRQYPSDDVTRRTKAHKERSGNVPRNRMGNRMGSGDGRSSRAGTENRAETERTPLPPKPQFAPSGGGGRENYTHRSARHADEFAAMNKKGLSDL